MPPSPGTLPAAGAGGAHRGPWPIVQDPPRAQPFIPLQSTGPGGAHRRPSAAPAVATSGGGAHRTEDPTFRRNLIAVGGAAVLAGQMAFSHLHGSSGPLLPDPAAMLGMEPTEATITPVAMAAPLASVHDGLEPVSLAGSTPELQQADAAQLAKTAGLAEAAAAAQAEAARQAQEAQLRAADAPSVRGKACAPDTAGLLGTRPETLIAGEELRCIFKVGTVGGLGSRPNVSDHPRGLAADFMTAGGVNGDALADYALKYKDELRIKYVIWKQRINFGDGGGWHGMENRGSITANHFDHVHISFL